MPSAIFMSKIPEYRARWVDCVSERSSLVNTFNLFFYYQKTLHRTHHIMLTHCKNVRKKVTVHNVTWGFFISTDQMRQVWRPKEAKGQRVWDLFLA